jgi:hypothetical protein
MAMAFQALLTIVMEVEGAFCPIIKPSSQAISFTAVGISPNGEWMYTQ